MSNRDVRQIECHHHDGPRSPVRGDLDRMSLLIQCICDQPARFSKGNARLWNYPSTQSCTVMESCQTLETKLRTVSVRVLQSKEPSLNQKRAPPREATGTLEPRNAMRDATKKNCTSSEFDFMAMRDLTRTLKPKHACRYVQKRSQGVMRSGRLIPTGRPQWQRRKDYEGSSHTATE